MRWMTLPILLGVAQAAPRGKVVRVERAHGDRVGIPRLCEIESNGKGTCLGGVAEVRVGEIAIVVDSQSVVAQMRIDEVSIMSATCPMLTTIHGTFLGTGSFVKNGQAFGVIDGGVDPDRGRLIADVNSLPSPNGIDRVSIAIDRDGDQVADIEMTTGACDGSGNPLASGEPCLDVWTKAGHGMQLATHTSLASCR
jgi:hypothetical protein